MVVKLADGTTETHEVRGLFARDSEGRIREEEQQPNEPTRFVLLDPVKNIYLSWNTSTKIANTLMVTNAASREGVSHVTFPAQPWHAFASNCPWHPAAPESLPGKVTTESLGQKTIDGIVVTGTRTTIAVRVVSPAGDRPIMIVHDVWYSDDLKLAVVDDLSDPRPDRQTLELEFQAISRTGPDPALFSPPEGYVVKPPFFLQGGILGGTAPPTPPPSKQGPQPIRRPSDTMLLLSQAPPVYPALAHQEHIRGDVVLRAIISKDGHVEQLSVISGHPLLIQAALDAVRQWRYQPTLLNGDPVEVDTTITVIFAVDN
jgi:TonB family protein